MAQTQTLKARVALPPVRQEEDEGSPLLALDATTVDADDEELPFNIAALALKRALRDIAGMELLASTAVARAATRRRRRTPRVARMPGRRRRSRPTTRPWPRTARR